MKNHNEPKKDDKNKQPRNRYDNNILITGSQSPQKAVEVTFKDIHREYNPQPQNSVNNLESDESRGIHNQETAGVDHFHVDSGTQNSAYFSDPDADMKIYPDGLNNLEISTELPIAPFVAMSYPFGVGGSAPMFGAFATQAITDNTNQYEDGKAPKPSEQDIEESRDWVQENKK